MHHPMALGAEQAVYHSRSRGASNHQQGGEQTGRQPSRLRQVRYCQPWGECQHPTPQHSGTPSDHHAGWPRPPRPPGSPGSPLPGSPGSPLPDPGSVLDVNGQTSTAHTPPAAPRLGVSARCSTALPLRRHVLSQLTALHSQPVARTPLRQLQPQLTAPQLHSSQLCNFAASQLGDECRASSTEHPHRLLTSFASLPPSQSPPVLIHSSDRSLHLPELHM